MNTVTVVGWIVQAVLAVGGAYAGARLGFSRFRSEKGFTRRAEWQEAAMTANRQLFLVADELLKSIRKALADPSHDGPALRPEDARALATAAVAARAQLALAFVFAERRTIAAAHVVDLILDEIEVGDPPLAYTLQRLQSACIALSRAMAEDFRKLHGWSPPEVGTTDYAAELQRQYDAVTTEADAKTKAVLALSSKATQS